MKLKSLGGLFKEAFNQWWNEDNPFALAAALSYYTFFSLAPLLIIVIAVASLFFEREATQNQIVATMQGLVGRDSAEAIQTLVESAGTQSSGMVATTVGVVMLLIGAVAVVGQLQDSLNTIWGVTVRSGSGVWVVLKDRFISFGMILGIGFLLLISLVASAALAALSQFVSRVLPGGAVVWQAVDLLVSVGFITVLFALIYKVLPDVRIAWRDVWVGALMTAVLFTIGKFLLGLYLGQGGVASTYGASGSLVVILLWVYYSALIFFFGAELTQVYATTYGSGVVPEANARLAAAEEEKKPARHERRDPVSAQRLSEQEK